MAPQPAKSPTTIQFSPQASNAQRALVLVYDLEGFSHFFNQPDVQDYIPNFLNHINSAISTCIHGGEVYWGKKGDIGSLSFAPVHEKFMGDGCLYVWNLSGKTKPLLDNFQITLANRLWNLKTNFKEIIQKCADDVPVADIPKRIRFGIAGGTVYELQVIGNSHTEYIGFCINLASRLQKYCPDLGFVASARMAIPKEVLDKNGYIKVVATSLRGFPREIVIVDKAEYSKLKPEVRKALFEDIS